MLHHRSVESAAEPRAGPALSTALPEPGVDARAHSARLDALIRFEIGQRGPIPFSRYMELALYAPGLGYYSAGATKFGAAGDFVTAPELGDLFARCVARAVAPTLRELGAAAHVVEPGGGSGAFAIAALRELVALDALPQRYRILEPSADLRERQRTRIAQALPVELAARVDWLEQPPAERWSGVLFANEVIDALPASRFGISGVNVIEEHVALDGDRLVRVDGPAGVDAVSAVRAVEAALERSFADGYRSEILPQLPAWMQAMTATLDAGVVLFVDYGYPRREFYLPERRDGTLVCHYRHRAHADPLHLPGLQDITAFVDFTAVAEAGVAAGLDFVGYAPQAHFLLGSGLPDLLAAEEGLIERDRLRLVGEAKRLTLPGDFGERFQAIAFSRGVDAVPVALRDSTHARRL